ncbi:MAG: right-handed parallel beta-helix repeat-containing protein, partial [Myxococcales bacterium]|nr:right-handed parallel beta-helix repeat-containing protein [Myxococcales bacterium]
MRSRLLAALATLGVLIWAGTAAAQTNVVGAINANTTWSANGSPYILLESVTIQPGITLTIDPGVEIHGGAGNVQLIVDGRIEAAGTAQQPILFRGTADAPNAWEGLALREGSSGVFRHVEVRHADYAFSITRPPAGAFTFEDLRVVDFNRYGFNVGGNDPAAQTLTFTRLDVSSSVANALGGYFSTVGLTVTDSLVHDLTYGIRMRNAPSTFERVIFRDIENTGLEHYNTSGAYNAVVRHCTFMRNGGDAGRGAFALGRAAAANGQLQVTRSVFGGNRYLATSITNDDMSLYVRESVWWDGGTFSALSTPGDFNDSSIRANGLLVDPDNNDFRVTDRSPARFWSPQDPAGTAGAIPFDGAETGEGVHGYWYRNRTFEAQTVNEVLGDVVITAGVTVTFRPGATLRMAPGDIMDAGVDANRTELIVYGTLEADGTNTFPVRFISGAEAPAPGDWYGIRILENTEAFNVSQVDLAHAVRGVSLANNDHIVAGSTIRDCSFAGIYVDGGTPEIEAMKLRDNRFGLYIANEASVAALALEITGSAEDGLYIRNSGFTVDDCRIHDNGGNGIDAYNSAGINRSLLLDRCLVTHNGENGVLANRSRNVNYVVQLTSSAVTHNTERGLYGTTADRATVVCRWSNVWGNAQGHYSGLTYDNNDCINYNPLYADGEARNYAPTRWSPHRALGENGGPIGPIPYAEAIGPQIMGYLWEDFTFTRQDSPYTVLGDLVVPAGVTVTVEPGVEFRVSDSDGMVGGLSGDTEIRFLPGSTGHFGAAPADRAPEGITGAPIRFRSSAADPRPGDWYGLRFEQTTADSYVYNARFDHVTTAVYADAPAAPALDYLTVFQANGTGLYILNAVAQTRAKIHGCQVIGQQRGRNIGIYLNNAHGQVTSSYVTHFDTAIRAYSNTNQSTVVDLVNNTLVKQDIGVLFNRANSSSSLTVHGYNNVIAESAEYAIRDGNSSYRSTDYWYSNALYELTRRDHAPNQFVGNITQNPLVEDVDWDDVPRWWDGKLWAESVCRNAGDDEPRIAVTHDILGKPRIIENRTDMGAWEFDPQANQEPRADPVAASIMVPRGEAFTLDGGAAVDPDGRIASAFWTMSDGTITAGQTVQHTFANEGDGQWAYITVVDDAGAEDHARVDINVNVRPIAEAGPAVFQDEGPAEEVFFDGTLSRDPDGNLVSWTWDFGDGSPLSNEQSPRHSYLSAGLYTVRLTVRDNEGLEDTDTTVATVSANLDIVGPLIEHAEVADGQPVAQPVTVRATVRDPAGVDSVVLFYRPTGQAGAQFALMEAQGNNVYQAQIPANAVTPAGVQYWITAVDGVEPEANASTLPRGAPGEGVFDFIVIGDSDPPVIAHQPVANGQPPGAAVPVVATITDATGVGNAVLFFRAQGGNVFGATNMVRVGQGDQYTAQIPAFVVGEAGVQYYIEAADTSPIPNVAVSPVGAPNALHSFTVQRADQQPPVIVHQRVPNEQTEGVAVVVEAGIVDAEGRVAEAQVFYRPVGAANYNAVAMARVDGNTWRGTIPAEAVTLLGVQYYLSAADDVGNAATSPAAGPDGAYTFTVTAEDRVGPTITHQRIPDGQAENEDVVVEALVEDPAGVDFVQISYRPQGFPFFQQVAMQQVEGVWTGRIPGFSVTAPGVEYYVRAADEAGNQSYAPQTAPAQPYTFSVGAADEVGPDIIHTAIADGQAEGQPLALQATVIDDAGVDAVTAFYRAEGAAEFIELPLVRGQNNRWTAELPGAAVAPPAVEYHLVAVDSSSNANASRSPAAGEHRFTVVVPDLDPPAIQHAPDGAALPLGQDFTVEATVTDANAIAEVRLHWALDGGLARTRVMDRGDGDAWTTTVAAGFIPAGTQAITYWFDAADVAGNSAVLPEGGAAAPFSRAVETPDVTPPQVAIDGQAFDG